MNELGVRDGRWTPPAKRHSTAMGGGRDSRWRGNPAMAGRHATSNADVATSAILPVEVAQTPMSAPVVAVVGLAAENENQEKNHDDEE